MTAKFEKNGYLIGVTYSKETAIIETIDGRHGFISGLPTGKGFELFLYATSQLPVSQKNISIFDAPIQLSDGLTVSGM